MDIRAYLPERGGLTILPTNRVLVPTGFSMAMPENVEAQIRPRSGLAIKKGITIVNSPGTIDSDYRGEVMIGLINLTDQVHIIKHGDRIAQMIINELPIFIVEEVEDLDDTDRGTGGFGSTGSS